MRVSQADLTIVWDEVSGETTVTVPYDFSTAGLVPTLVVLEDSGEFVSGQILAPVSTTATTLVFDEDITSLSVVFGLGYSFLYDFSPVIWRLFSPSNNTCNG